MAAANPAPVSACVLFWSLCLGFSIWISAPVAAEEVSLVVSESTSLQLHPNLTIRNCQGSKPGTPAFCERVRINGLSRLKGLKKFAHTVHVKVLQSNLSIRTSAVEVCFHRNTSLEIGMCPQGKWEKLAKGSWIRPMSPFDNKLLDIRISGKSIDTIKVSIDEEFFLYRIIFLVVGIAMMTLAPTLSQSLVFYYGGAMTVGVILVVLMVLYQGMKLLPTGRKSSLAIFVYSSIVGLGSFVLHYVPRLLQLLLEEIGVSEDMYYPLAKILLVLIVLVGAWLGFWFVRKLVLKDDESIDPKTSLLVKVTIYVLGFFLLLETTLDIWLALEASVGGILVSIILRRVASHRILRKRYRTRSKNRRSGVPDSSPFRESPDSYVYGIQQYRDTPFTPTPFNTVGVLARTPPARLSPGPEIYCSTFHDTPERRKFTKKEWEKFTRDSTKEALVGLVSSPDFSRWAAANAERLTLKPKGDSSARPRSRWWFLGS